MNFPTALAVLALALSTAMPAGAASPRKVFVRDFDGDGKADLLWQGHGTASWLMNGAAVKNAGSYSPPDINSGDVVMTGDFNGDGRTDFLWRGKTEDRYDVVLVNGLSPLSSAEVSAAGSGWEAVATGDFDGDGKADILWKSAAGAFRIAYMNGTAVRENGLILSGRPELSVAAVADFNGDGRSDVLWTAADGSAYLSIVTGPSTTDTRLILNAGSGWYPAMTGDLDGDGHADIVWRHPDGRHGAWYMASPFAPQFGTLIDANTGWSARFVRDLDGDGKGDIVWAHADGSHAVWLMNGGTPKSYASLVGGGTGWSVVATDDYDGDGKDDLLWRANDGSYAMWLMNGTAAKSYQSLMNGGSGWDGAAAYEGCDRTRPGSFTIAGSTALVAASGAGTTSSTKSIFVQRTPGTCGGAYTVNFTSAFAPATAGDSSTGYSPLPAGSISFADGEAGIKPLTVATGSAAGTYTLTLGSVQPVGAAAATTASGNYALATVVAVVATTGVAYPIAALNAQQFMFGTSEFASYPPLKPGEVVAASFVYQQTANSPASISIAQVTNPIQGGTVDIEIALSATPGDFPGSRVGANTLCSQRLTYPSTAMTVLYGYPNVPWACNLTPGQRYYINVRQVSANYADGEKASCTNAKGCALRVQPQSLY